MDIRTPPSAQPAGLLCRCLLIALTGCSVVVEGSGPSGEIEAPGSEDAATPWIAASGGLQAGPGAAYPAAPGGAVAGATSGGAPPGEPGGGGLPGGAPPDAAAPGGEGQGGLQCSLDGVFALDFEFDVLWEGTEVDFTLGSVPVIDQGAGMLTFALLAKLDPTAAGAKATARVCSTEVPDFSSNWLQERYAPRFDPALWESSSMPRFSFDLELSCPDPPAPCELVSKPIHAQLGSKLKDPAGQWPGSAAAAPDWPDHDGDLEPGITAQMLGPEAQDESGRPYFHPPIHPLLLRRVTKMMLGLRMQLLMTLELLDCDTLDGFTRQARVDSRTVGCTAEAAPYPCSAEEVSFLDTNLPIWAVREGRVRGVRMEADADCAAARAAFPRAAFR